MSLNDDWAPFSSVSESRVESLIPYGPGVPRANSTLNRTPFVLDAPLASRPISRIPETRVTHHVFRQCDISAPAGHRSQPQPHGR
jgi:hypothetical protein